MDKNSKILITGSMGMVGKSLVRFLKKQGYKHLLLPTSKELNLSNQQEVINYFKNNKIDYIFHLASKVGGIKANIENPGNFLYENILINSNILESSRLYNIKLLFLGSSCIYPKECIQPMKEEYLMDGKLEPTNEGYALSKIVGLKLCEYYNKQYETNFISLMPPNMYGPYDHFEKDRSHVISALILKFYEAKVKKYNTVEIWGSGNAKREFLYVDDLSESMVYFMNNYDSKELPSFINVGSNEDISIKDLSYLIKKIVGYNGGIVFNKDKPEGMKKKLLDSSKAKKLGWESKTELKIGIEKTYRWYLENKNE